MSDITATNCGCERDCGCNNGCENGFNFFGNGRSSNNIIWILILLAIFNNNDGCGNCGCDNSFWILLILLFCCGGFGGNCFDGCGC